MAKELKFESPSFGERIKGMLGVDFYRLFHTSLFYIFLVIAAVIPAMILGTSGMENPQTGEVAEKLYTDVWHIIAIGLLTGLSMEVNGGSSVYACLSASVVTLIVCIICSVAWAVIYNVAGTHILNMSDVY